MFYRYVNVSVIVFMPFTLTKPTFADQAQTDLEAALAYNQLQQAQQVQQSQQLQQQEAQASLGLSGAQPYCQTYGTCAGVGYNAYGAFNLYGNYFNPGGFLTPFYLNAGLCQLGDAACPAAVRPRLTYTQHHSRPVIARHRHRHQTRQ